MRLSPLAGLIAQAAYPDVSADFTDAGWERMADAATMYYASPNPDVSAAVTALNLIIVQCEAHYRAALERGDEGSANSWSAVAAEARHAIAASIR